MLDFEKHGLRLFDTHKIRRVENLEGKWRIYGKYGFDGDINIPGVWEQMPQWGCYRGTMQFVKAVTTDTLTDLRFYFEGVSFYCTVYFDGNYIGEHYGAYTPFALTAKNVKPGEHTLKLYVSNKNSIKSALHIQNDYYSYGGINRGLQMEYIPRTYIDSLGLVTSKKNGKWTITASVCTKAIAVLSENYNLKLTLNGKTYQMGKPTINGETLGVFEVDGIEEWSPESPKLYEVTATLFDGEKAIDDLTERTGFREVSYNESGLYVNGKRYFLKGVNRHEDYNYYGSAVPFEGMIKDLTLIKNLGANAVRTSHYPNNSLFLDMCDELGLLVWEETHSRGLSIYQMYNPYFDRQVLSCAREMVKWHIGHPSIVIWGCLNECVDFMKLGKLKYKKQISLIRSLDKSRPVTFASCKPHKCLCLDLEDIISFNLYYGWSRRDELLPKEFPDIVKWIRKAGGKGKPIIMSEFGCSALKGTFDPEGQSDYSEDRQYTVLKNELNYYMNYPDVIGVFIWQFCDIRVSENHFNKRPGGINSKGLVNALREPKMGYKAAQEVYRTFDKKN